MRASALITLTSFMIFACTSALVVPQSQGEVYVEHSLEHELASVPERHKVDIPIRRRVIKGRPDRSQAHSGETSPTTIGDPRKPDQHPENFQARSVQKYSPPRYLTCDGEGLCQPGTPDYR